MLLDIQKLKRYEEKLQEEDNIKQAEANKTAGINQELPNLIEKTDILFLNSDCIESISEVEVIGEEILAYYMQIIIHLKENTKKITFSFIKKFAKEQFLKTLSCMINNNQK